MTVELEQKLQKRLDEASNKKESQLAQIKSLQADLQKLLSKLPRRPRESLAELDKKIADLERERTITSISLSEERQILKQINGIKKSKGQVEEYHVLEKQVQEVKGKLDELRDGQKTAISSMEEIEAALSKVKLANRLGCRTQELVTKQIECPQHKLGQVIGKNGSMIKQIMEATGVTIDVSKESNKIDITGSEPSVDQAIAEIDKIARAIEDTLSPSQDLINYLTAKHITVMSTLREEYKELYIDISRKEKKIIIRGAPERVHALKDAIQAIDLAPQDRTLTGRESAILLGKKGGTIDRFITKYHVSIEVDKIDSETGKARVIGPSAAVEAAMEEIEELMNDNREVIENIPIDIIIKRIMLADTGKLIKALQASVNEQLKELDANCYLSFDKEAVDKDHPELAVKAKNSIIAIAMEYTEAGLEEYKNLVTSVQIDPYIVPRIIGKGGETIRKLTQGKPSFVEVDRSSGKVLVGATTVEEREALLEEVKQLIDDNSVIRVPGDKSMLRAQFRELQRSKTKAELSELAWLDLDENNGVIILRGKKDDLVKAKELTEEFLVNNHLEEVTVTDEDFDALLSGGKDSQIMKMSEALDVGLRADRSRFAVIVKGTAEKVAVAKKSLDRFLNGGDGHSVARLTVTEQVVGVIIGKGGKTRQQLEEKYDGIAINISKSHCVSIRGPEQSVADCRVEVLKMVASARITQTLPMTEEQYDALLKNDGMKRITQQAPAQITFADDKVTVRGFFYDVRDAVSLLNEQLTGEYKSSIELETSQFSKVRAASRDPSHFQRMEEATNAKVALDMSSGSIVVSGKRSNVKKAKDQVFGFLGFLLPGETDRLKITKPLFSSVGQATTLAEISATVGGAAIYLDRDLSCVVVRSTDPKTVQEAAALVKAKIETAERLAYVFEVRTSESWLIPIIIGKNGNRISALQKDSGCKVDVSKEARTVTVIGESEENVSKVREALMALVDKARRENVFITIPEPSIALFVGKGGARMKELSSKHGVEIVRIRKGPYQFKITGDGTKVEAAKAAIDAWVAKWEQSNGSLQISVEKQFIQNILGPKGETARTLQDEFGCRIDVDRQAMTCTVKGGDTEKRAQTLQKIEEIIAKAKEAKAEAMQKKKEIAAANAAAAAADTAAASPANNGSSSSSKAPKSKEPSAAKAGAAAAAAGTDEAAATAAGNGQVAASRASQFPTQPVGVSTKQNGKKNKPVDKSVQQGTEAGRNLFQLLVSDP